MDDLKKEEQELAAIALRVDRELGRLRTELAEAQLALKAAVDGWRKALQFAQRRYVCSKPEYLESLKLHEAELADFEAGLEAVDHETEHGL